MRASHTLWILCLLASLSACDDAPPPTPTPAPASPVEAAIPASAQDIEIVGSSGAAPLELSPDGQRLPLARILQIAQAEVAGEVIEVDLDDDDDEIPEYEIAILTPAGRTIEIKIDARRGTILEVEED